MILHLILFSPRPELAASQRRAVVESFRAAAEGSGTVRRVRIGRRVRHGLPGYESLMREDFEYFAELEFDDLEGLKAYLEHPSHAAAGGHFSASAAAALAFDYAVMSPTELARLGSDAKND